MKQHNILLLALLAFTTMVHAQDMADDTFPALPDHYGTIRVGASLSKDQITIGDTLTLHLTVSGIGKESVEMPSVEDLTQGPIEALDLNSSQSSANGLKSITNDYTLISFDAGRHNLAWITVHITDGEQEAIIGLADSLILNVAYVADIDTTDEDLKKLVKEDESFLEEPATFWEKAHWPIFGTIVAAVIAAIVYTVIRLVKHKPVVTLPKAKPVPADKRALSEFEALRRKELWQKGQTKRYYTEMTDIVRRYLFNMYRIKASEMTSRQTLRAFRGVGGWSEENASLLAQLLQKSDMVKFAKSQPESYEHDLAMQQAVDFVRRVTENQAAIEQAKLKNNTEKKEKK
ncbi:MAG: hypothetical protein J6X86_07360 [Bacteroidales bacterium]|nr:hypothetical protein [Bacteroidales bacterium]